MSYYQLKQENKKLRDLKTSCQDELEKLREAGRAHENQIDTLLKFNERLLGIIENEFNSAAKYRLSPQLQPITQANQATPEFAAGEKLKSKLPPSPPKIGGGLDEQDLQGILDDDEEQIYNQESKPMLSLHKNDSPPQNKFQSLPPQLKTETLPINIAQKPQIIKKPELKHSKLDKVYEMQHNKDEQISINLSNSLKNSNPNSNGRYQHVEMPQAQLEPQMQQLRDMIREYKEEFVDNSSEYEQICKIIHNDLVADLQQLKKISNDTRQNSQKHLLSVQKLKKEIKNFRPANELARVIKKLKVPQATVRILYQRIINKTH